MSTDFLIFFIAPKFQSFGRRAVGVNCVCRRREQNSPNSGTLRREQAPALLYYNRHFPYRGNHPALLYNRHFRFKRKSTPADRRGHLSLQLVGAMHNSPVKLTVNYGTVRPFPTSVHNKLCVRGAESTPLQFCYAPRMIYILRRSGRIPTQRT